MTEGRRAAESVLRSVSRGRRLDRAFDAAAGDLPPRDRRFVQVATYGVCRFRGRLDHLLGLHLRKGLHSLSPGLLNLLRLGAYQLLYMGAVPPYAAISQTVDQVRAMAGEGPARLANGVLRSLEREGGEVHRFPDFRDDPESHLSTWGSHPRWMIRRWLRRWDPTEVQNLVSLNNQEPELFFRPLDRSLSAARELFAEKGIESREAGPGIPCLKLKDGTDPAHLVRLVKGVVQDPASALVTVYADAPREGTVADLCAAPGGKSLAIASGGAYVVAADRSLRRLQLLRENLARVGGKVDLVAALAQAPPFREMPFLLLDVPCSGTGTLRRHPDARWRLTEDTVLRLAEVQRSILEAGSRIVPKGGVVVYSTCTLETEENEGQVGGFLGRNPGFSVAESGKVPGEYLTEGGYLFLEPQRHGFDGAFAARLVRES